MTQKHHQTKKTGDKHQSLTEEAIKQSSKEAPKPSSPISSTGIEGPPPPRRRGIWRIFKEFLIVTVAHLFSPQLLAIASVAWLFFKKDPTVPLWVFILVAAVFIGASYFILISVHYFFEREFILAHRWKLHVVLIGFISMVVIVPIAMMQAYTAARTNQLVSEKERVEEELRSSTEAKNAADARRQDLYDQVTKSLRQIFRQDGIGPEALQNILHRCTDAIRVNNAKAGELRASVVYIDKTGNYLIYPKFAYWGAGLYEDITGRCFDVSPRGQVEDKEAYLKRIGVAGWCYRSGHKVLDSDVQQNDKDWRYKVFAGERNDRAMICVPISDLTTQGNAGHVGVLSISSLSPDVLTESDVAVAQFFAALLGRFQTPLETPSILERLEHCNKE